MACPTMSPCSIVSCVHSYTTGNPPAPTRPPPTQRKGGTIRSRRCYIILLYTLRAFGKNIWGEVSQKVVRTCDKSVSSDKGEEASEWFSYCM